MVQMRRLASRITLMICGFVASAGLATAGICPVVGGATDCDVVITITDSGTSVTITGQPPYDGIDDMLIGVANFSSQPIRALGLTSALPIFALDGDGVVAFGLPGNAHDGTGYGGPNAYFTNISPDKTMGTVNFITPIPAFLGIGYFSLETSLSSAISCQ